MSSNKPLKILFAGTPDYAAQCLASMIADKQTIIAVYTQPDRPAGRGQKQKASPVKSLAQQHGIPIYQPTSLRNESAQAELAALKPDLLVVAAYGLILPQAVLDIPKRGCLNIHPSLLPRWRGAAPIQHTLLAGDTETGVTIMQMEAGLDTGPMLLTLPCAIDSKETSQTLHDKLARLGGKAICQAIHELDQLKPIIQDDSQSTYADKFSKADAKLDWQEDATYLIRKIRAFNPAPVAFFTNNGEQIRVWLADVLDENHGATVGRIIKSDNEGIDVACKTGAIRILELQLPGKKRLPVSEVLKANQARFQIGVQLDSRLRGNDSIAQT